MTYLEKIVDKMESMDAKEFRVYITPECWALIADEEVGSGLREDEFLVDETILGNTVYVLSLINEHRHELFRVFKS